MMLVRDKRNRPLVPWFNFPSVFEDFDLDIRPSDSGLNMWEDDEKNKIMVRAALPGMNEDDIDVQVKDGLLTIRANKEDRTDKEVEGKKVHSWSMKSSYYYSTVLPGSASNEVDANLEDGVLTLEIAKSEESKPKKIQVKRSK